MKDESRRDEERQEGRELVARYEEMIRLNTSWFFDIDQFEQIIAYYFERGLNKSALKVIKYAENLFPGSALLQLREAQVLAGNGELSRSIPRLKNLLTFEPFNDEIYLTLASIYGQQREHDKAIKYYQTALRYCEEEFKDDISIDLALECESAGKFEDAIDILKETITRNPKHETATFELAYCFDMAGQTEESIRFFTDFIDDNPYSFPAWFSLGNAYTKQEVYHRAVNALEYCVAIRDDFAQGWICLANAHVQEQDYAKAIEAFETAAKHEKPDATILCYMGECFEKLELLEDALRLYEESIKSNEKYADAYIGKSVVLDLLGEVKEALVFMERAHELDSENDDIQLMLAELLNKLDREEDAESLYLSMTHKTPQLVDAWLDYAHFYYSKKDVDQASKLTEQALGEMPDNGSLLFRKVAYLHAEGKVKEAMLLLEFLFDSGFSEKEELLEYYPDILNEQVALNLYNSAKA